MSELRGGSYPALGINVPQPGAGANPLGMMGQFAEVQNRINQNLMFQQSWQARAQAGEILASEPDPERAVQKMFGTPSIAPWAPMIANETMQYRNTTAQYEGQLQTQAKSATEAALKNLPALYGHPENWPAYVQMVKAQSTPQTWPRVEMALDSMRKSLVESTNADGSTRTATADEFLQRTAAMALPHITGEQFNNMVGKPEFVDTGVAKQPFLMKPGTSPIPVGAALPMGAPPSYRDIGGVPTAVPGIAPGGAPQALGAMAGGGGAGLAPGAPGGTVAPGTTLAVPQEQIRQLGQATASSKFAQDHITDLSNRVTAGQQIMQGIGEMRNAMATEQLGPQAAWRVPLATLLAQAGFSKDTVDSVAGGSFANMQELQKMFVTSTMGQLRSQLPAGSRMNLNEWDAFVKNNPRLETDPHAIEKIFNFWGKQVAFNNAEAAQFPDYIAKGGDPYKWSAEWANRAKAQGFTPDPTVPVTGQAKGTQGSNLQHLEGKTVRQGGVTYRIQDGQAIPLSPSGQPIQGGQSLPAGSVQ